MQLELRADGTVWMSISSLFGSGAKRAVDSHYQDTQPAKQVAVGYRLVRWPALPGRTRTAKILRALSVMTQRDVTARWFALRVNWPTERAVSFLESLVSAGDVQRLT